MTTDNTPRDDEELEAFLVRQSGISTAYDNLERVEPPAAIDEKILAIAQVAARPAVKPAAPPPATPLRTAEKSSSAPYISSELARPVVAAQPAAASSASSPSLPERRKRPRAPTPEADTGDTPSPGRRPRWLLSAAVAVAVALAIGLAVFINTPKGTDESPVTGSLFAKRPWRQAEAEKAGAEASAEQDAEVAVQDAAPLPPPPIFEPEGPQVQDLDAAIALIRKELVLANQTAAVAEEAAASQAKEQAAAPAGRGKVADTAAAVVPVAAPSVVQPRERRLTKILELYDGGNPDLASDSLEIFLRDFEDDPISQRILKIKP